jgi:hypothetical protein
VSGAEKVTVVGCSPSMRNRREDRLEDYIQDWYWDRPSHEFARKLGRFLLEFLDHLREEGLSRKTINVHSRNCWCIGKFECDYGNTGRFSYRRMFSSPAASHVYWFEHKWSRSKSSVGSYRTTWRRLYKYTKGLTNVSGGE